MKAIRHGIVGLILIWAPLETYSHSCWRPTPEEYVAEANLIFRGTVTSVEVIGEPGAEVGPCRMNRFRLIESFKGPALDEVEVKSTLSGPFGRCDPLFEQGTEIMVFARGNNRDGFQSTHCLMSIFDTVMRSDPKFWAVLHRYRRQRREFDAELNKPGIHEQTLKRRAAFLIRFKEWEDADTRLALLRQALPNDLGVWMDSGQVFRILGNYQGALNSYRTALALAPNNSQARLGLLAMTIKLGKLNELSGTALDLSGYEDDFEEHLNFENASLSGARFLGAHFRSGKFSGADLRDANFSDSSFGWGG